MPGQCGSGRFAEAGDDVDHTIREARLLEQFTKTQRGERRLLGGLQDDGATGREGWAKFPRRHEQRKIPRDDLPDHADGFALRVGKELCPRRVGHRDGEGAAVNLGRPAGHVAEQIDGQRHVGHARHGERLAVVERFESREFLQIFLQQISEFPDQLAALGGGHGAPRAGFERGARGLHGGVHVRLVPGGDGADGFARGGIKSMERLARGGIDPLTVDQHAARSGVFSGGCGLAITGGRRAT